MCADGEKRANSVDAGVREVYLLMHDFPAAAAAAVLTSVQLEISR